MVKFNTQFTNCSVGGNLVKKVSPFRRLKMRLKAIRAGNWPLWIMRLRFCKNDSVGK